MAVQKRIVQRNGDHHYVQKSSDLLEQKTHKCWRRFMNERTIHRAYVPTSHGIHFFPFYLVNFSTEFSNRTCSKLFDTRLSNYSCVYCCSTSYISC